ncbi:hypothetical protein NQ315_015453 [Exocentrus adspersus]|uniref:PHD and RING finger domain-containing protein 1 n=1 Tax=Exocentrus adspersus TaxID=1586481 RepID=A0AAV8VN31_9CUCU|nr:hypothetical protein NQ315_015453 [Exocentrus adspersus]
MSSDDSDGEPHHKRKRKLRPLDEILESSSTSSSSSPVIGSSSSSPIIGGGSSLRRRQQAILNRMPGAESSDSESDSGSSIHRSTRRKKVRRVAIDSDSDTSGSDIIAMNKRRTAPIASDSDVDSDRGFEGSSSSQWETDLSEVEAKSAVAVAVPDTNMDSDSSDGQSEKCPICLISFKTQEIGTPESCDHMFCLECIQEWSKNMNTCPVDRQEYTLILVRKNITGKVIRQVAIEKPAPQNDVNIVEDPTFCEICGSSNNEDQMLLCDGCDLGFHLYCLNPPLQEVPGGAWFCNECSGDDDMGSDVELYEFQLVLDESFRQPQRQNRNRSPHQGQRRSQSTRLVPRTRQTERVRRRIASNRQQTRQSTSRPSTSSSMDLAAVSSTTSKKTKRSKKSKRKTKRQVRYKTVYEIDEATGETVAVKKRQKRNTKSRKASRPPTKSKTVKKRLAAQLGMCAPRATPQNLPDVKVQSTSDSLGNLRSQAGIPTLHLFGQNHELDYFSEEEEEGYVGNSGMRLLTARVPNRSDVSALRRVARRKAAVSFPNVTSTSADLLGSILNSQEQLHSRSATYRVDSSGKFVIEQKKSATQSEYVDVKDQTAKGKEAPNRNYYRGGSNNYYRRGGYNRYPNNSYNNNRPYQNQYHSSYSSNYQYHSSSSSNTNYGRGNNNYSDVPQDYTQRTLCATSQPAQDRRDREEENPESNTPNSESEIDIYSDIETVSTSKIAELPPPPMPPDLPDFDLPDLSGRYTPTACSDYDNDSEPDMVIDDNQEPEQTQEDTAVTSTVGPAYPPLEMPPIPPEIPLVPSETPLVLDMPHAPLEMPPLPPELPHSSLEIQSGAVQSSDDKYAEDDEEDWSDGCPNTSIYSKENIKAMEEMEEDDYADSDDGCPNFSIYSKESKTVALHTDISFAPDENLVTPQDNQVEEVSSSPSVPSVMPQAYELDRQDAISSSPEVRHQEFEKLEISSSPNAEQQQDFEVSSSPNVEQQEKSDTESQDALEKLDTANEDFQEPDTGSKQEKLDTGCQESGQVFDNLPEVSSSPAVPEHDFQSKNEEDKDSGGVQVSSSPVKSYFQEYESEEASPSNLEEKDVSQSSVPGDQDDSLPPQESAEGDVTSSPESGHTPEPAQAPETSKTDPGSPSAEAEGENVTYDFEKDAPFPQENTNEEVTYDFERNTDLAIAVAADDNAQENVVYDFEKQTEQTPEAAAIPDTTVSVPSRVVNPELELSNPPNPKRRRVKAGVVTKLVSGGILGGLYSDSDDEDVVRKGAATGPFAIADINHMTEDISEEERSYTPCLDERGQRQGLEGLDTEMISDEDRNDFDESHELKTVSDGGDALEINAKESELDFTRPEDYEEGEIVDKNKGEFFHTVENGSNKSFNFSTVVDKPEEVEKEKKKPKAKSSSDETPKDDSRKKPKKKEKEKPTGEHDSGVNKENEGHNKDSSSFKKLSKSSKERNYRDKDLARQSSPTKFKEDRFQNKKEKKREKRKELERYSVRAVIAEKPRSLVIKDQFGRDVRRTPTKSRSRSYTPPVRNSPPKTRRSPSLTQALSRLRSVSRHRSMSLPRNRSPSRGHASPPKSRPRKRRTRSHRRSPSRSRSRSPGKKRPSSKNKKRKRSPSRHKNRKSRDRSKKKPRTRSKHRSASPTRRNREWNIRREWTPISMSPTPNILQHISPSWTPPRMIDTSELLESEALALVSAMNASKKKKEKKRKGEKRLKEGALGKQKKRRRERERTPPPSKEVFASGDNILVSVSFNNENETRDVTTREKRKKDMEDMNKKKKEKRRSKNRKDVSGIKPVAIIDLERSPFKEMTPSPKDVIVLTDSDNNDNEEPSRSIQNNICDSSQQVASPEQSINFSMGPKTPPEPQIKFSLTAKPPQVRAINNPLIDPEELEISQMPEEINRDRISESVHKGPNTPPEPPNSPPSSPDVYDPFEPTKSRSPTPEPMQTTQSNASLAESTLESRAAIELLEKSINPTNPELIKSLTPPIADVQPADSQSSIQATPESDGGKSPERINVVINQTVQPTIAASKPVAQTTPFSSVPTSMITSTPVSSNVASSRINVLNSTIITPPHVVSSLPQRIILPNQVKSSPVKISPTKPTIKSTPIKPMPNKNSKPTTTRKSWAQNGSSVEDPVLDFDSPYSPGSSDYEDLFEPPAESIIKSTTKTATKSKSPQKSHQSVFDALFGSPSFNKTKTKLKFGKKITPTKTKTVGVKLDEDNLRILDELPNSAVEMQVKDKFLKKLNRQERVVEEVKLVLKPHYNKKRINKEEYKDILRRAVPKICHNKSGEINPTKIKNLIEAYVKKIRHSKKVTSSSSLKV